MTEVKYMELQEERGVWDGIEKGKGKKKQRERKRREDTGQGRRVGSMDREARHEIEKRGGKMRFQKSVWGKSEAQIRGRGSSCASFFVNQQTITVCVSSVIGAHCKHFELFAFVSAIFIVFIGQKRFELAFSRTLSFHTFQTLLPDHLPYRAGWIVLIYFS